jgi:hypothetical protein
VVNADITTAYGRVIVVPLQLMTYHEWQEIGLLQADPSVPFTELDSNNKPTANYQDKDYLKKLSEPRPCGPMRVWRERSRAAAAWRLPVRR